MGWLSNIFKSGQKQPEQTVGEIGLKELESITDSKMREKDAKFQSELKELHEKILGSSRDFAGSLESLLSSQGPEKIDDGVMNVAKSFRSSMAKAFNTAFMELNKPVNYTVKDFGIYFGKCNSSLAEAEHDVMRFVQPLREVFPGEMKRVMKSSEQMSEKMSEISGKLEKIYSETKPLSDLMESVNRTKAMIEKISSAESELRGSESLIAEMKSEKEKTERGISELLSGEGWQEYQRKKQELAGIQNKKEEIRSVVIQLIGPMDKAMKRLKRNLDDSQIDKEILETYINDPFDAFLRDDGQKTIDMIVAKIKEAFEKGGMDIDTEKEQKILRKMSAVESGGMLSSLRKDYDSLEKNAIDVGSYLESSESLLLKQRHEGEVKSLGSAVLAEEANAAEKRSTIEELKRKIDGERAELAKLARAVMGEGFRLADAL